MRLLLISWLLVAAASIAQADFKVLGRITTNICYEENCAMESQDELILCGARELVCGCYRSSGARSIDYESIELPASGEVAFTHGLCGGRPGAIVLTRQENGSWNVGEQGSPGEVVGNCVEDRSIFTQDCGLFGFSIMTVRSQLHCTSPLCGT